MSENMVTIYVDGAPVEVPAGTSVVDAAHEAGVEIPIFCHHPNLEPVGMCRMCLVEVGTPAVNRATGEAELDEEGNPVIRMFPKLQAGCTMRASEGMVVNTTNQEVTDARRSVLEFLLTSHPLDCPVCDKGGECPLQNLTMRYGPGQSRFTWGEKYHFEKPVPIGPLIALDRERCVLCARCIRFEDEIADDQVLGFENRGRGMEIVSFSDPPFQSYFSGNTSDICPVGALTTKDFRFEARAWEVVGKPSVCSHCPVGCNTMIDTRFGAAERVMPRRNDEVNEIWLCDKGRFAHHFASDSERLTTPLVRRDGELQPASWDEALGVIAERLGKAKRVHGAESIGGIAGPGLANEDLYLFGRLMRAVLGSNNLDHRPSMLRDDLIARAGANAEGASLSSLGQGDTVVVAGLDVEEEAPVVFLNLLKGVSQGARLVILSGHPQKLDAHADAALRYRYSDVDSLMAVLLKGLLDAKDDALGEAASAMRDALAGADADSIAGVHPVGAESLATAVEALHGATRVLGLYGREAAEHGLDQALAALISASGEAGAAGGLISAGSHANSQGAADMGLLPNVLPGYAPLDDAAARARLAEAWSCDIAETAGKNAEQMLGKDHGLRALYLMGTDPAGDDPRMAEALKTIDFLVVQELFLTSSAALADVVLPARSAPERNGSYTNMQRRIQRFYASVDTVGDSRSDWAILRDLGQRMGVAEPYSQVDDVFEEIARVVPGYQELSYASLGAPPPPDPSSMILPFAPQTDARSVSYHGTAYDNVFGEGRVWSNQATRDAEAGLGWRPSPKGGAGGQNDAGEPGMAGALTLVPTRKLYDMGALVAPSKILHPLVAPPMVEISAFDAAPRGLTDGVRVKVMGIRGALEAELRIRDGVSPGVVQAPESLAWSLPVRALLNGSPTAEVMIERIEEDVPLPVSADAAAESLGTNGAAASEGEVDA